MSELTDFEAATISYTDPEVELVGMVRVNDAWCVNSRIDLAVPGTFVWYLVTIASIERNSFIKVITNKELFYKCTKLTSSFSSRSGDIYGATSGETIPSYITDVAIKAIAAFDQGASA